MTGPDPLLDKRYMVAAIALGRRGLGRTAPNPAVGCIIVNGAGVVARGWTAPGGRPHAETIALERAGTQARGATAYVSLEPCAHRGRTPPCADALIGAGIARVVTPIEDPDPRVAGQGHARLRKAGVEVVTGVLADEARRAHAGFLSRVERGRPWVVLKLAVSADGMIAAPGDAGANLITGDLARARGHLIRARADAVMVGMGTVRADDPELTCRLPGLEDRTPVRVVLTTGGGLPAGTRLTRTLESGPVWLVSTTVEEGRTVDGVRVLGVPAGGGRADPLQVLRRLADEGINTLMVEGGAEVAAGLVAADLVDEVALFMSPDEIGSGGLPALRETPLTAITDSARYVRRGEMVLGRDRLIAYERARTTDGA